MTKTLAKPQPKQSSGVVRDQDGVPQEKGGAGTADPQTQGRGQGAHDYSNQDAQDRCGADQTENARLDPKGKA